MDKEKGFVRFLKLADNNHNMDNSIYQFLDKDLYGAEEPYDTHFTLFSKKPPFRLYFKGGDQKNNRYKVEGK